MAWNKGTSGNPNGNPGKDKLLRIALLMELKSEGQDMPALRHIARKCIDLAIRGESWAIREIWDRLDGKSPQFITSDAADVRRAIDLSDDELAAIIAAGVSPAVDQN
jgi:hypothetical protein